MDMLRYILYDKTIDCGKLCQIELPG